MSPQQMIVLGETYFVEILYLLRAHGLTEYRDFVNQPIEVPAAATVVAEPSGITPAAPSSSIPAVTVVIPL